MRRRLLLTLAALGASVPASAQPDELAIALRRDMAEERPVLAMSITNRSATPICLRSELIENPATGEMEIGLREVKGPPIVRSPDLGGYHSPARRGIVRLDPGEATQAKFFLDWRFLWPGGADGPPPRTLSAYAAFRYGHCDDAWSRWARSDWQPI